MSSTPRSEPTPIEPRGVRRRIVAVAVLSAVIVTSYLYAPWVTSGPVLCMLRASTGIDCPSCGMTRSFCAMARGRPLDALGHHWLGPLLFVGSIIAVPLLLVETVRRRTIPAFRRVLFSSRLASVIAVVLVVQWSVRTVADIRAGHLQTSIKGSLIGTAARHVAAWLT